MISVLVVVANATDIGAAGEPAAPGDSGAILAPPVMDRPPAFDAGLAQARLAAIPAPEKNPKLSSHVLRLIEAEKEARAAGRAITGSAQSLPPDLRGMADARLLRIDDGGFAQVFVHPSGSIQPAAAVVEAAGGTVERLDEEAGVVQAQVPIGRLVALSADPAVRLVRLPNYGFTQAGSVTTQGDSILRANIARSSFNVNGTGVRVGVISDGVSGLASSQASGDLPAVNYTTCNIGPGNPLSNGAEGTAMLEIVHDLAPGAELWFGDFDMGTASDFNAAVDCLAQNTDVVVDDIGWFGVGPYDGTSFVSANTSTELNRSTNRIRAYTTSVANQATSHYEEPYTQSPNTALCFLPPSTTCHQFAATGATGDALGIGPKPLDPLYLLSGGQVTVILQWDDPFFASGNDYDLYLIRDSNGAFVAASEDPQTGSQIPVEGLTFQNTGASAYFDIQINKFAGVPKWFDMFIICSGCVSLPIGSSGGPIHNYNTVGSSVPSQSDSGGGVISVGAINAADPGNDSIAPYSSRGPTNDNRTKPDITGIDGVSVTGNGGFPSTFYGTSAASPHIGAIAALLLQCHPPLKTGEPGDNPAGDRAAVRNALLNGSIDLGAGGMDNVYGSGRADAVNAANALSTACSCVEPSSGGPAPPPSDPGFYHAVTPARILDTRTSIGGLPGKLGQGCVKSVQVAGVGGVPASGVSAVVLNTTVAEPSSISYVTLYPSAAPLPLASNLNFSAGQTIPNLVKVKVGADGKVNVFNKAGGTHVILDVAGWYDSTPGGSLIQGGSGPGPIVASDGGADTIAIDMDIAGNTASSLGALDQCARINENGVQDANETGVDTLTFDVTAQNIPPYNDGGTPGDPADDTGGIIGYSVDFTYPSVNLTVETENLNFILTRNAASSVFPASEPLPDDNANDFWQSSGLDTGTGVPEAGDGVLTRVTISSEESAGTGQYEVSLANSTHLDASGTAYPPHNQLAANIAINQACGAIVSPTPTATAGPTPTASPTPGPTSTATPAPTYGYYHPVPPARVLDTRSGPQGVPPGNIGQDGTITVDVTGVGGVPATGVSAVVLNTTVTGGTNYSFLTVFPSGAAMPLASNLNFGPGETVPNLVIVKVGADGNVKVFNKNGAVAVIMDVAGWFGAAGTDGVLFRSQSPARVLDTRTGPQGNPPGPVDQGETITVDVTNVPGSSVPATGVAAVVLNVTVTGPTSGSFLTVFPEGALPLASNLNFDPGETVPNLVIVKVGADGNVRVYNKLGSVHVIFDVAGWYSGP